MSTINKKFLKRLSILYVEDDLNVTNELTKLLSNFFNKVYSAKDGREGLEKYKEKQDEIDIIIADINMPNLSGTQMLQEIRTFDKEVPVIFATAYSDNGFLYDAIKLKVSEYVIKPIDIRKLLGILNDIATGLYNEFMIKQQNKELKKYKDIMYSNNIVIRTNKNMKISFVNDLFCEITGFDKKELIGKELSFLKYNDADMDIYAKIYNNIYNNKQWNGQLKNKTKDNNYYISDTSVIASLNDTGEVTGSLIIQKDETKKFLQKREMQHHLIKDKSEIFKRSKETTVELEQKINALNERIDFLNTLLENERVEKIRFINSAEKYAKENKRIRAELNLYKKDAKENFDKDKNKQKLAKENADLRVEIRKLNQQIETIKEEHERNIKQEKVNFEIKIDDLEEELEKMHEKLENIENADAITQKLAYWKEKAKNESKRVEKLEKEIILHGDKNIMTKLFGNR